MKKDPNRISNSTARVNKMRLIKSRLREKNPADCDRWLLRRNFNLIVLIDTTGRGDVTFDNGYCSSRIQDFFAGRYGNGVHPDGQRLINIAHCQYLNSEPGMGDQVGSMQGYGVNLGYPHAPERSQVNDLIGDRAKVILPKLGNPAK